MEFLRNGHRGIDVLDWHNLHDMEGDKMDEPIIIPFGYCHCGCGGKTNLAVNNNTQRKYIKGQPYCFIRGHQPPPYSGRGPEHPSWKGGVTKFRNYTRFYMPDHPNARSNYVFEHVLIAEKALGKYLPRKAVVHHHTPEDLVVCENQAYHLFIEARAKAWIACGNANHRKCQHCQKWDDPNNLSIGRGYCYHQHCSTLQMREYYQKNKEIINKIRRERYARNKRLVN